MLELEGLTFAKLFHFISAGFTNIHVVIITEMLLTTA